MLVSEVMSRNVEWTTATATLAAAARQMRERNIGCLPVGEGDRFIGILTDKDFTTRATADGLDPNSATVSQIMTTRVIHCQEDDTLEDALEMMRQNRIRHLPVYGKLGNVVGILSLTDLAMKAPQELYPVIASLALQRGAAAQPLSSQSIYSGPLGSSS